MRPYRNPVQLSTWKGRLGILDIDTQLNSLKTKWIQRLLYLTNGFWKDIMLYWLNLIFNSNQGLVLFRQTQILRSTRHKNVQKPINEDFFIQLLNPCLHFINNKFTSAKYMEEIREQPIFLNPHTKLNFSSNNPYF